MHLGLDLTANLFGRLNFARKPEQRALTTVRCRQPTKVKGLNCPNLAAERIPKKICQNRLSAVRQRPVVAGWR